MPRTRRTMLQLLTGMVSASVLAAHAVGPNADAAKAPPLRLVVAYHAHGPVHRVAQGLVAPLSQALGGRRVVLEVVAGNSAKNAIAHVAKQPADGNTLLVVLGHALPALAALDSAASAAPASDFVAVSEVATTPKVLVAHRSLPVHSMRELVLHARAHLNSAHMGSLGEGSASHVIQAYMSYQLGAPVRYVPYPGEAPILKDLLAGQINLALLTPMLLKPHLNDPSLQFIASLSAQRNRLFPDVPTMQEMGYPQPLFHMESPISVFALKGTPDATIEQLGDAFFNAAHTQSVKQLLHDHGMQLLGSRAKQAQKHVAHYFPIIKEQTQLSGAQIN